MRHDSQLIFEAVEAADQMRLRCQVRWMAFGASIARESLGRAAVAMTAVGGDEPSCAQVAEQFSMDGNRCVGGMRNRCPATGLRLQSAPLPNTVDARWLPHTHWRRTHCPGARIPKQLDRPRCPSWFVALAEPAEAHRFRQGLYQPEKLPLGGRPPSRRPRTEPGTGESRRDGPVQIEEAERCSQSVPR
jgi:hypothetical protein